VDDAIVKARRDFPDGVLAPELDDDLVSQDAVVYAITGSGDPNVLTDAADVLKRQMLSLPSVQEVDILADPGEQITIEYDDTTARRLGISPALLGRQLAERSRIVPGGLIHLGEKTATLRPQTEFRSLDELRRTPILLPSGTSVPLSELARVRRGPIEPASEIVRWNGEPAVAVAIVPQDGLDRVVFGREIRERAATIIPSLDQVEIQEMFFQPDLVEDRLSELIGALRLGIFIVAGVLFLTMGLRLGVLVATVVPLVTFASVGLFSLGGGILHQISIAALVIALGMLVDNAIVVVENIQFRVDEGIPVHEAAVSSVRELALPLGTATGTTLAAFVPMLIAEGNTADFTRSIPIVIMLTLGVSYLFAILVTPVLSEMLLRPSEGEPAEARVRRIGRRLGGQAVRRPVWVLVGAFALLGLTLFLTRFVDLRFFPASDRPTVIVELEMPEGTHLESTDVVARRLEAELLDNPRVDTVGTFVGRNGPRFYYNLLTRPASPHRAMLVAEMLDLADVDPTVQWVRDWVNAELPEASVVARRLEQGPPVEAPVEVRVLGWELTDLEVVSDEMLAVLQAHPDTRDVRHDLSLGVPTVELEIDDTAAGRRGLDRGDVAISLLGRTLGVEVGQYRMGEDPVRILVRSAEGEKLPVNRLDTIDVTPAVGPGTAVPLAQVASLDVAWQPAAIHHKDRRRMVKVQAQVAAGATAADILADIEDRLTAVELPAGVRIELGGELEESGKANSAIQRQMPLGLLLLLTFLLLEFDSFRRVGIVLVTVPLAVIGVVPGLILSGQPFGFMSLLGMISLIGIVVNNAIVLLDVIESQRKAGRSIDDALLEAVTRRTRPILLTMATTIAGLSPLAFSGASLWPPLAWAMISGLIASTMLTLMVIPALYKLLFDRWSWPRLPFGRRRAATAAGVSLALVATFVMADRAEAADAADPVDALSLDVAVALAIDRPNARAADQRAIASTFDAEVVRRATRRPTLTVLADGTWRDEVATLETPAGDFTLGDDVSTTGAVVLTQPLFDPAQRRYAEPAAVATAESARANAVRVRQILVAEVVEAWVRARTIDDALATTDVFIDSLTARLDEMEARVRVGRILESDALKIRLDLESAELDRTRLTNQRRVARSSLGRAVGRDAPVAARWDGTFDRDGLPTLDPSIEAALAARPDRSALEGRLRALELQAKALRAERLPKLEASAAWLGSDGDPFRPES
ncbi:MAG: efflux RND transporter permease subunit, partial [Acidobacteriota bacterium]